MCYRLYNVADKNRLIRKGKPTQLRNGEIKIRGGIIRLIASDDRVVRYDEPTVILRNKFVRYGNLHIIGKVLAKDF